MATELSPEKWAKLSIYMLIRRGDDLDRTLADVLWVLRRLHWDRTGNLLYVTSEFVDDLRLRLEPEQGSGLSDAGEWADLVIEALNRYRPAA